MPPFLDFLLVPGQQDVRHRHAFPFRRTGIDRGGQQVVLETVEQSGRFVVEHARQQPPYGVHQHGGGQFAPGQHVIADADFQGDVFFPDAFVHPFVVAAQHQDVVEHGQAVAELLVEPYAVGRGVDDRVVGPLGFQLFDAGGYGFRFHDHAGSSAKLVVVHLPVFAGGKVAQVMQVDFQQPFVFGPFHDGVAQGAFKEFGQYGEDVETHGGMLAVLALGYTFGFLGQR